MWLGFFLGWERDGLVSGGALFFGFCASIMTFAFVFCKVCDAIGRIKQKWTLAYTGTLATFVTLLLLSNLLTTLCTWLVCFVMGTIMWEVGASMPKKFPGVTHLSLLFLVALPIANVANALMSPLFGIMNYWESYLWTLAISASLFLLGVAIKPAWQILKRFKDSLNKRQMVCC